MSNVAAPLVWIDLEMTGLEVAKERIIEIATIITDSDLNIIAEGPNIAISQDKKYLDNMDEWNQHHHGKSGLIERVQASTVTQEQAQAETLRFLSQYLEPTMSPLCGNSISNDRRFLAEYMPELEAFFHYRQIDVSTLKELARRWAPAVYEGVQKKETHQALADIRESIEELRHYRKHFIMIKEAL